MGNCRIRARVDQNAISLKACIMLHGTFVVGKGAVWIDIADPATSTAEPATWKLHPSCCIDRKIAPLEGELEYFQFISEE